MGIFRKIAEKIRGFKIKNGVLIKYKGKKKNVVIPKSVTEIRFRAFDNCRSLKSIVMSKSVTSITNSVFICNGVFAGCDSLENITVEQGNPRYHSAGNCIIETVSKTLIAGCKNSVIPADGSVTSIGSNAFSWCSSLKSIVMPKGVTSVGNKAFAYCHSLESIVIPEGVTSIDSRAFSHCINLTSIVIPGSVTSIDSYAFSSCRSLTSINILDGVTSIGDYAFDDCSSLTSITIPNSVTSIGDYAFDGCHSLKSIVIPNSVTSIGRMAFSGCYSLKTIEYIGTEEQWKAVKKGWGWESENAQVICTGAYYGNSKSI